MTTLKQHQAEMVKLLATGSGIPASASRLAHAMHDVLEVVMSQVQEQSLDFAAQWHEKHVRNILGNMGLKDIVRAIEANSPGLNEKALSKPTEPIKTDSPAKRPLKTEQRIKQLNNTIQQLRDSNAKLREKEPDVIGEIHKWSIDRCLAGRGNYTVLQNRLIDLFIGLEEPEQAGCRKPDTQVCEHAEASVTLGGSCCCTNCGADVPPEKYL